MRRYAAVVVSSYITRYRSRVAAATTISFLLAHTYQPNQVSPSSDHDIIGSVAAIVSSTVAIKTCLKRAADVLLFTSGLLFKI